MKNYLIPAAFIATLSVGETQACPHLPEDEQIELAESIHAEAVEKVAELSRESDLILIGRATEVSEERVPISEVNPDGASGVGDMVYGTVRIEPIQVLKGSLPKTASFTYTRDESQVNFSCGLGSLRSVYPRPTYRFIFYIRDSEVLRVNQVVDWFDELDSQTEIELILNGS